MYYYHVICGKKHMDLVAAKDEIHAIAIVKSKFGEAKCYSTTETYKAIKA